MTYGAITFQQSGVFGVCLDIGGSRAGAMVGLMNTIAQVGGLVGSVLYGYIVDRTGSYDAPFIPMTVLLLVGAALWLNVDASREIGGDSPARLMDVVVVDSDEVLVSADGRDRVERRSTDGRRHPH